MSPTPKFIGTLKGTKNVIIGGTSGMGFAVAQGLIEEGAHVAIGSSSEEKVKKAIERLNDASTQYNADPSRVQGYPVSVAGPGTEASLNEFYKKIGPFDNLIFTAGVLNTKSLEETTYESIVATGDVRYAGAILAVKAAVVGGYLKEGGSVVFTSGAAYHVPHPGWAVVSGFCGAMVSLTRALAVDLSSKNIRVNCISLGPVRTELWGPIDDATAKYLADKTVNGRVAPVEEPVMTYLSVLKNKNINGEMINDDGGSFTSRPQPSAS
ncbi:hypothetical protein OC846_001493 [Tilletia horrida]|uniref:Uncharacterized protein n=1 Tax=Tilletia horrida TaxID=155126 RepID=A0AAN6JTG0_9BASI|nr:hypothetical protein OC845_001454 [Tilletia horrida]KAK0555941.1 hypothetical protein OC846_001493 [Tilletia horrida]KAK0568829.1 hypothetical protein OC861_001522 [Tilletia horrida]